MQSLYSVIITGQNNAAPSDGFIDNLTVPQYVQAGSPPLATLANGLAKARANQRYKMLCQQLSLMTNIYTSNMDAVGADANTAPTSFTFTAAVEHGDDSLYIYDETNNNAILVGLPALVRMVARALVASEATELMVIDPTGSTAPGNNTAYQRVGPRFEQVVIGAVCSDLTSANGLITVTKIS